MYIIGIGVDIIENYRINKLIKNKKFISRIFSKKEISKAKKIKNKTSYYAKRFAAKESISKAIGTGFIKDINFKDISIYNDKLGKPYVALNSNIKKIISSILKTNKFKIFISLTDEKKYSIAFTVIQK